MNTKAQKKKNKKQQPSWSDQLITSYQTKKRTLRGKTARTQPVPAGRTQLNYLTIHTRSALTRDALTQPVNNKKRREGEAQHNRHRQI